MDIDYLFKFIYTFCILFYFYYYRKIFSLEKLIRLVVYTTSLIGAINIFSMITQTGILSYSDKFGFGYSGYYADGNALGVYMVLAVLLCIWYSFYKRNVFYCISRNNSYRFSCRYYWNSGRLGTFLRLFLFFQRQPYSAPMANPDTYNILYVNRYRIFCYHNI